VVEHRTQWLYRYLSNRDRAALCVGHFSACPSKDGCTARCYQLSMLVPLLLVIVDIPTDLLVVPNILLT
jgi:hypothetical protein